MILEIFVAIFVVIFTTMMAASSTGNETEYQRMQKVEDAFKKLKKESAGGGPPKDMQAAAADSEKHYKYFGVNTNDTSSSNTNVSSSDNKPVNSGPFEGGTLGQLLVEAAPPPIWTSSKGKNEDYTGDVGEGPQGPAGPPGESTGGGGPADKHGNGKKGEGEYLPGLILNISNDSTGGSVDNSNFARNQGAGFGAGYNAHDNAHVDHIGETEETGSYSTTGGGIKKDIDKICDIYNANVKDENEKMTYETFSKEYGADLEKVSSKYGHEKAGEYLSHEVNKKGSGKVLLKELDDLSKFKKSYKDSLNE